jgi:two-component system, OmpR family, sensor kinase
VTVLGDEPRLRQVVTNLVANALQHTPDDAMVEVRVGRPSTVDGRGTGRRAAAPVGPPVATVGRSIAAGTPVAAVEVVDTGPGMSAEAAGRAFERLYRADPSRARRADARADAHAAATGQRSISHGGAGLGLSIVAAIVQAHDGRVELWTAPGRGARFRVLLPAQPPAPDDEPGFRGSSEET